MVSDEPGVRTVTTERERAQSALGEHFSQGRLAMDEFEERSGLAAAARTSGDLARLFSDLPGGLPAALSTPLPDLTRGHRSSLASGIWKVGPLIAFMLFAVGLLTGHGWALVLLIPVARGLQHR